MYVKVRTQPKKRCNCGQGNPIRRQLEMLEGDCVFTPVGKTRGQGIIRVVIVVLVVVATFF